MRPITAHVLGHFCMNFKKIIFFEYLIMFRNFLAKNVGKKELIVAILVLAANYRQTTEKVSRSYVHQGS